MSFESVHGFEDALRSHALNALEKLSLVSGCVWFGLVLLGLKPLVGISVLPTEKTGFVNKLCCQTFALAAFTDSPATSMFGFDSSAICSASSSVRPWVILAPSGSFLGLSSSPARSGGCSTEV